MLHPFYHAERTHLWIAQLQVSFLLHNLLHLFETKATLWQPDDMYFCRFYLYVKQVFLQTPPRGKFVCARDFLYFSQSHIRLRSTALLLAVVLQWRKLLLFVLQEIRCSMWVLFIRTCSLSESFSKVSQSFDVRVCQKEWMVFSKKVLCHPKLYIFWIQRNFFTYLLFLHCASKKPEQLKPLFLSWFFFGLLFWNIDLDSKLWRIEPEFHWIHGPVRACIASSQK